MRNQMSLYHMELKARNAASKPHLSNAMRAALEAYANSHGRTWKSQLLDDWMTGRSEGELQQVRNIFGPRWLQRYKLEVVR
jgi:hypothetical protein